MSNSSSAPVVLELAPLPREQVGPFLLLGVDKTADSAAVERHWAERIKMARRQQFKVPLEDINWAREMLNDQDQRIKADAASLNMDTADGVLRELSEQYGAHSTAAFRTQPLDVEKNLAEYSPPVELPDIEAVRAAIVLPEMPSELQGAHAILEAFLREPIDPWHLPVRRLS